MSKAKRPRNNTGSDQETSRSKTYSAEPSLPFNVSGPEIPFNAKQDGPRLPFNAKRGSFAASDEEPRQPFEKKRSGRSKGQKYSYEAKKLNEKEEVTEETDSFPVAPMPPSNASEVTNVNEDASTEEQASAPSKWKALKEKRKAKKEKNKRKPKKRGVGRFFAPLILLAVLLAGIVGCLFNINYCKTNFDINFYHLESLRVTSEVRVVVIADLHLREYGKDNETLVNAVKDLYPDIIISAGDLVSYGEPEYDNMLSLCRRLAEIAPFYGIMGNHEDEKTFLEHDEQMREKFAETGMNLLINTCEKIRIKNNDIELVGVSGGTEEFDLYGGKDTMESLDEDSTALRICCAHVPTLFTERLDKYKFDIGIAGHTHGGVVRLPVLGGLYSAEEGLLPEFDGGVYRLKNGADLFVSRGLGSSGAIPRVFNTPELAVVDIRWY